MFRLCVYLELTVLSPCTGIFTSPGPDKNNEQFLRPSSCTSNQVHLLKASQYFLLPEFSAFTVFCQWTSSTEPKDFCSLLPDCSAPWDYKEDTVLLCFHPCKSSMETLGNLLPNTECQQPASQPQTKPGAELTQDSRRAWCGGSQRNSGGTGKRPHHSHTAARAAVEQGTRETANPCLTKEDTNHQRLRQAQ